MVVKHRFKVTVKNSRREEFEETRTDLDGNLVKSRGSRSVPLADTVEEVEVEVDFGALARLLGPVACKAKGGKSVEASGLVVVRKVKK